jgi:hypothetical protein
MWPQIMQQSFNEYRCASIDVGIEQILVSDVLLMSPSVAESRFIDSVDDKNDVPCGIPVHDEEEIQSPISEFVMSQTWYCTEIARLHRRDAHDLMGEQIFQNRDFIVETLLKEQTESLGLSETIDVKRQLFE